jgi:acyl transferase domain-containing protein
MPSLNNQLRHNPIAIIGMGAIMPQAHNLREFWNNIIGGVNCITDVPESHWKIDDYYDPDPSASDKTYCKRGGFLPEMDFDPMEFGLPPNILEVTDVSQMLSLLVAKEALTDAGYIQSEDKIRDRTGVILGVGGGQKLITPLASRLQYPVWDEVLKSYGLDDSDREKIIERMKLAYIRWEENSFPGMLGNVIAGRIANRFDLGGTNCVVDAACASTMAALKMALSELTEHRADMMITGGADTDNSIFMYMCFSKTPAFSKGTNPRPFDVDSDGMMVGEGIGMIVLKRLADAERDGDRIYAVIKGLGSSSDGRFKSIYAPRGEGQEKALRRAYEDAGFSPATVGLVEAHGTGTVAGDTTEVTTIIRYFNQHDTERQHIALGSVKSQIGHTKASAGAAGLIKMALALHHKVLPPTLNVDQPNPKFDMPNSAFYINTEARPWVQPADDVPRRAGVSSFGFGGTNFHVVMEEYHADHLSNYRVHTTPQAIILNAGSVDELRTQITSALTGLHSEESERHFLNLARATRQASIPTAAARVGLVAQTATEAAALLQVAQDMLNNNPASEGWQHPKGVFYRRSGMNMTGRVVALFAGQGSQYLDMGRDIALNFPEMREAFTQFDGLMKQDGKATLSSVVFPRQAFDADEKQAQEAAIQNTDYAQPAIGAVSAGMFRMLQNAGFRANFTAGHSFGELTALWAAGALRDEDYAVLVKARGAAMAPPADNPGFDAGTMMAVTGDIEAIEREITALPGVKVANRNSPTQVVVAGSNEAVKNAEAPLTAKGFKVVPLSVAAAFHTPLVGHAQKPFAKAIQSVSFQTPHVPVYSNASGKPYPTDPTAIQSILSDHILNPVLFRDEIENIYAAGGTVFVEFGPRNVLTNLVKDILGERQHVAVALNGSRQKNSDRQLREAIVQLQVLGLALDGFDPYGQEIDLPAKKKGMNFTLTGASYVSEKTHAIYQAALATPSSVTVHSPAPSQPEVAAAKLSPAAAEIPATPPTAPVVEDRPILSDELRVETDMPEIIHLLDQSFNQFREHQRENLRVHEQYAHSQSEYFRIFFELTQQQQALLAAQTLPSGVAESLMQNMMRFHDYQSETLRMHEQYMQQQTDIAKSMLAMISQQYASLSHAPSGMVNGNGNGTAPKPAQRVEEAPVIAVKPSAPVEQAPAIVSAPAVKQGQAPVVIAPPAPVVVAPVAVAAAPVAPAAPTNTANAANLKLLSDTLLRIVDEKTGYPIDMLELSMDMEADLGIDSIKRVEILGAMRESFPNLPQFSPEELAELRTLHQIVDYMQSRSMGDALPTAVEVPVISTTPTPPAPQVVAPAAVTAPPVPAAPIVAVAPAPIAAANNTDTGTLKLLEAALLRIVDEKTGYPVDMLELSMDMEADLGIDSIKRVEILGAMRESFPKLPQFSPEELAELRTLQQIVDYMEAASRQTSPFDAASSPEGSLMGAETLSASIHDGLLALLPFNTYGIERRVVSLHRLPTPDWLDFTVTGAVCIVTDDGTSAVPALVQELTKTGWQVVTLSLPTTLIPSNPHLNGVAQVQLEDASEESLKAALTTITSRYGAIGGFIHLNPARDGLLFNAADKALVKFAFLMAKYLKPHLSALNSLTGRPCFITLTRLDGALGTTVETDYGVIAGGLFGLVKTLSLEWDGVFCRALDVHPSTSSDQIAHYILAEIHDPNRLLTEVAYGTRGRMTLTAHTNGVR